MTEESPEQRWNRLQERIRKAILETYPNPDREGCPRSDVLLDMAMRAAETAMRAAETATLEGDARWQHVTHCAPCYQEFLDLRETLRRPGGDCPPIPD